MLSVNTGPVAPVDKSVEWRVADINRFVVTPVGSRPVVLSRAYISREFTFDNKNSRPTGRHRSCTLASV